ncbi:MAG: ubiquinol-cytochrome c reductase iron-sulfur subunit [Bauldia sp.]|nr:ubiquinol-cytochrome c reductase iron-sulfur subunit [Bauldia sp.]
MDHSTSAQPDSAHPDHPQDPGRRDFIYIAAATVGAVGVGLVAWPFIDQMNPDEAQLALATIEVDISAVEPGMSLTVQWRGKPVFIRHRTEEEIAAARAVPLTDLKDQTARNANLPADALATDENRAAEGHEAILIMVGVCTHLGCVPLGDAGDFGGWFCPCHGSHYDTAGRIRLGPAPFNLDVPVVNFLDDATVRIG